MLNPTITLAQIRTKHPCSSGWTTLLTGLGYSDGKYDPERVVSLGDVATINGAADALWCVRALDWSDINVRRAVIAGVVLGAVTRALKYTTDKRVHNCVDAVRRWCAGDDTVDLKAARKEARNSAADAAYYAADACRAAYYAADAAYYAAADAAYAADAADADADTERTQQRADIIVAFPCLALATNKGTE